MKVRMILACFLAAIFSYAPSASALSFDLNIPFGSAGAGPTLPEPLLTAVFDDVIGGVGLKLSAPGLPTSSYVTEWYFNVSAPIAKPVQQVQPSDPILQSFLLSTDNLNAGPTGAAIGAGFDIKMTFSNQGDLFESQESAVFLFSLPTTITANWFNELNTANAFYAAAKIMNNGNTGEFWIASGPSTGPTPPSTQPVPEPGTLLLSGIGLTGLAFFWRRKKFLN